jgi:antitoxin YefM
MYYPNMMKTLSITKAREELPTLVDRAKRHLDEYIITVNGEPIAVLLSFDEYESWKETNEIMSDPKLMEAIHQGEADIDSGNVYDWEDVKKDIGLSLSDNVQNKTYRKSKKRT